MGVIEALFRIDRLPFKVCLCITACTWTVLLAGGWFAELLGLVGLPLLWRAVVGMIAVLGSCLIVVNLVVWTLAWMFKLPKWVLRQIRLDKRVRSLTTPEQALLREFLLRGARVLTMPMNDDAVISLRNAGLIEQASVVGEYDIPGPMLAMELPEDVRGRLTAEALGVPEGLTPEQRGSWSSSRRPAWAQQLAMFGR